MKTSTLNTLNKMVKSLKFDGLRGHMDYKVQLTKVSDDLLTAVCTNGNLLLHTVIDDSDFIKDLDYYFDKSEYVTVTPSNIKIPKKELKGYATVSQLDQGSGTNLLTTYGNLYLQLDDISYPKWQTVVPVKFKEVETIFLNTHVIEQASKALKALDIKSVKVQFSMSDLGPIKLTNEKDNETFILVMPKKEGK